MVGIAQMVEHLVVVQDVAGSSPVTHPEGRAPVFGPGPFFMSVRLRVPRPDAVLDAPGEGSPAQKVTSEQA